MTRCHQAETCCKQASFLPVDRAALSGGARVPGGVPPLLGSPPHPRQGGMCPCSGLAPGGLCPRGSNGIASPLHSAQASPALSTSCAGPRELRLFFHFSPHCAVLTTSVKGGPQVPRARLCPGADTEVTHAPAHQPLGLAAGHQQGSDPQVYDPSRVTREESLKRAGTKLRVNTVPSPACDSGRAPPGRAPPRLVSVSPSGPEEPGCLPRGGLCSTCGGQCPGVPSLLWHSVCGSPIPQTGCSPPASRGLPAACVGAPIGGKSLPCLSLPTRGPSPWTWASKHFCLLGETPGLS